MSEPEWDDGLWDNFVDEIGPLRLPAAYCPYEPSVKQEFFLIRDELEVFFGGAAGPGKLVNVRTEVPTPSGWTTIGELAVGDEVFGEDGRTYEVEWLSHIDLRPESYRLTFDDGSEIEACADHLWLTFDAKELAALTRRDPEWRARRRARRPSRAVATPNKPWVSSATKERNRAENPALTLERPTGTVRTTREIAETVLDERGRRNHAIPVARPLDLPALDLPLDPYVLGAWLGDGTSTAGTLTADPSDQPHLYEQLAAYRPHPVGDPKIVATYGLTADLRRAGVLRNKHVPPAYLRGSIAQRLALLQGLMDTDGTIDEVGYAEFTSTNQNLAEAAFELACSLGQKPSIAEGRAKLNGIDYGPKWRVTFTPTIPAFRLPRKLERQTATPRRTLRFRYVVSCDRIPAVPMRCIRVSNPTGLFLVGRTMIPTHNSWALLMAALQYADVPDYHALIVRPELQEFYKPRALIPVSHDWLGGTDASWNGSLHQWTFPVGSTLSFGYVRNLADLSHFKGPAYAYVGFDELTEFPEQVYLGMSRVLRDAPLLGTTKDGRNVKVPLRKRSASNPGGPGHGWVKTRFIDPLSHAPEAHFIKALISDNPKPGFYEEYLPSLSHLTPIDRARLLDGDWDVSEEGGKFHREMFQVIEREEVTRSVRAVRYWDLAGTEPTPTNTDPDWTVGLRLDVDKDGTFTIRDIVRGRWEDAQVQQVVKSTAALDGRGVPVFVEQDPGQAGKAQVNHYKRHVLPGYIVRAGQTKINGRNAAKEVRARPVAAAVGNGLVRLVRGANILAFLDEVSIFPNGDHDDCVDALSGAHTALTFRGGGAQRGSRVATATIPSALERETGRW